MVQITDKRRAQVRIFNKPTSKGSSKTSSSKVGATSEQENAAGASDASVFKSSFVNVFTNQSCHRQAQVPPEKTEAQIQADIQAIFRQITASVTFLPTLDTPCTFNVLVYADADSEVPLEWGDSDAREIEGGERVQLRGFSTSSHRVDTMVSYKHGAED